jgi:uncharacterized protein
MMTQGGTIQPIETYRDALNTVFTEHGVVVAYLYGSQARGDAGPLSDVDIAVLFSRQVPAEFRFKHILGLHSDLARVFERDDVNVVDLEKGTPLLNNNVRLYGIVLYCSDEKVRVRFELRALQQYLDTKPLRREMNRAMSKRLRNGLFAKSTQVQVAEARIND